MRCAQGGGGRQRTAPRGNVASLFSQTQTVRDAGVKSSHRQPGGRLLNDSDIEGLLWAVGSLAKPHPLLQMGLRVEGSP